MLSKSVKDRHIDDKEFERFATSLTYASTIPVKGSCEFDDTIIDTTNDAWSAKYQGVITSFNFDNILGVHSKNFSCNILVRWAVASFISSYSLKYAYIFSNALREYLSKKSVPIFTLDGLFHHMQQLATEERGPCYFSMKRFTLLLIEHNAPGFEPEDMYVLEQLPIPKHGNWDNYYDTEVKLKPYEVAFIQNGLARDYANVPELSYSDLLENAVISLCFETGLRPIQLYQLHDRDLKTHNDHYFSITRPLVKNLNKSTKRGVDNIQVSRETGILIQSLQSRRQGQGQLLRDEYNELSSKFNEIINSGLCRWGASQDIRFTTYDFRHNVGHTLAMQGASAEEIAFVLGHNNTMVARHYISATPEIAKRKQLALGGNEFYQQMVGMIMTGEIVNADRWTKKEVIGEVGSKLCTGIGGCAADSCKYHPVHSCYSCKDYNPFLDGRHADVLDALREQASEVISASDAAGQIAENPAIHMLEGTIAQVKAVISRCELERITRHEKSI